MLDVLSLETLSDLAARHPALVCGTRRESIERLREVEACLGVRLPADVVRLLTEYGYGSSGAVPNIARSVSDTERFRRAVALPRLFVVLDDRNDAGTVLLDTGSPHGRVIWVDTHALDRIATDSVTSGEMDEYSSFAEWLAFCVQQHLGA